ncbi:Cysteine-rich receptor-like protein kinase 25 [Morella rubra]|uniref:Cysteine-rich receptor-like protein kinase 25 n=1 Tax=Morella rubra TaxID=262757 RepID=A0A6A1V1U6_9ROSI|nr:Cysteine-rich receptor-like protein kinase 25 [Morella rubra]
MRSMCDGHSQKARQSLFWEKIAIIWYDECMLRYFNRSIFSTMTVRQRVVMINTQNTTPLGVYNELVNTAMEDLAKQALGPPIGAKKFGTSKVNLMSRTQ